MYEVAMISLGIGLIVMSRIPVPLVSGNAARWKDGRLFRWGRGLLTVIGLVIVSRAIDALI